MIIGVPKETKCCESRVSLIPSSVLTLTEKENKVYIEKGAGEKIGFTDDMYEKAGAVILDSEQEIFAKSEVIVKVKELQKEELAFLKNGQTVISYAHLAIEPDLVETLLKKKITTIAYETIQYEDGSLPLLKPMSEIAGKVSVQIAANLLQNTNGGTGKLIGGVPGVYPCKVLIIGAGVVGKNAARIAIGMGADVTVLDISPEKLTKLSRNFNGNIKTAICNEYNLEKFTHKADIVIGAILKQGHITQIIRTEEKVKKMKKGSVIMDISVDQGGMVETITEPTDFNNPTFEKYGVIHYAVPNIPSCVARTATISLNNYIMPYLIRLADKGFIAAVKSLPELYKGINTFQGKLTNPDVAKSLGYPYSELSMLIGF